MTDIDLSAYFERIGYTGNRSATLDTLREIHRLHALAIPFENLDPVLRRPVSLDIVSLQKKLIADRRGGYCYEQNLLFQHVLRALGFSVTGLAARVIWTNPEGVITPRSHMLNRVDLEGTTYVADVGFGGITLTEPLVLEPNTEQSTSYELFRLVPQNDEGGGFAMDANAGGKWRRLYRFDLTPQYQPDYEISSWYLCTNPKSHFLTGIMAARPIEGGRYALNNNQLTIHRLNGEPERRTLTSAAELRDFFTDGLGITLPDSPDLEPVLARVADGKPVA
ncbi:arylamine N-acetyltransferase [Pendulispora albinea]|uniref:Arylamine N-acetyltransferase n=1 Tax=Pendulispora albinea TaxID=2741071 RepID=A0ABZ2M2T7_9BACT